MPLKIKVQGVGKKNQLLPLLCLNVYFVHETRLSILITFYNILLVRSI